MKLIYENYIHFLIKMGQDHGLAPNMHYRDFRERFTPVFNIGGAYEQIGMAMDNYHFNDGVHYVLADNFYKVLDKYAQGINIETIDSWDLFNHEELTFQISMPGEYCYIIDMYGNEDKFALNINQFLKNPCDSDDDFVFWRLRGKKGINCKEMLNDFMSEAKIYNGSRKKHNSELLKIISIIINSILYIRSGRPDLRQMRSINGSKISFEGKKRESKLRKYQSVSFHDHVLVGFDFKKETEVDSYLRWQAYGPSFKYRRLQLISGYTRNKQ